MDVTLLVTEALLFFIKKRKASEQKERKKDQKGTMKDAKQERKKTMSNFSLYLIFMWQPGLLLLAAAP